MSLIQTNKKNTQKNKVKIDLEIEKQMYGLYVKIQSDELNNYVEKWLRLYQIMDDLSIDIYQSLNWDDGQKLNNYEKINLSFLVNSADECMLLDNVFTDGEIQKYISDLEITFNQIITDVQNNEEIID
jgi:hypothetical protein